MKTKHFKVLQLSIYLTAEHIWQVSTLGVVKIIRAHNKLSYLTLSPTDAIALTVPLGSIRELPAKSCKEIKDNEDGNVNNGNFWFYSLIPGTIVRALCDMDNEGNL